MKQVLYIFDGISENKDFICLPLEVEKRIESLKKEYFVWLYKLGKTKFKKETLIDVVSFKQGFSLWWMSNFLEKHPGQQPYIYKIFKLRTIELLIKEKEVEQIIFISGDTEIFPYLRKLAEKENLNLVIKYNSSIIKNLQKEGLHSFGRRIFDKLPHFLQSIIWLFRIWLKRIYPIKKNLQNFLKGEQITIISYFPNIDLRKAKKGKFVSNYWGNLPELIKKKGYKINWILWYAKSDQLSFKEGIILKDKFNKNSYDEKIFFLEEFCDIFIILKAMYYYFKIYFHFFLNIKFKNKFIVNFSKINFFRLCRKEFYSAILGRSLIASIFYYLLLENIFNKLPKQKACLYLCEMQGWEKAVCNLCTHKKIKTVGVQHSSIKPGNLRWFHYFEVYQGKGKNSIPIPDILAVNGGLFLKYLVSSGYPEKKIKMVEAIRYLYLLEILEKRKNFNKVHSRTKENRKKILLVVTGYFLEETYFQLTILNNAYKKGYLKNFDEIWIKPHPYMDLKNIANKLKLYEMPYKITKQSLDMIFLKEIALVFAANSTSASLEAAYLGIPVIICASFNNLNLSPFETKYLVFTSEDFYDYHNKVFFLKSSDIFHLDKNLKRWDDILNTI